MFSHVTRLQLQLTHTHTRRVPHGCQYDLVEQVVVQLLGHLEAGPLHGDRGGQTQDDAEAAQHAEYRQIPRVAEATVLPRQRECGECLIHPFE